MVALPASANGQNGRSEHHVIHGTVVSDDGTTLVITNHSGTHDILVNSNTKYSENGDPNPVTTASPGQFVAVKIIDDIAAPSSVSPGPNSNTSPSSNTSPTVDPVAGKVSILLDSISGVVSTINGSTVTLTRDDDEGKNRTVNVSAADIYQRTRASDGTWTTTPATLAVNDLVTAYGEPDKTTPTTFDAQFVKVRGNAKPDSDADTTKTTSGTTGSPTSPDLKPVVSSPSVTSPTFKSHDDSAAGDSNDDDSGAPSATWVKGTVVSASNDVIVIQKEDGSQVTVDTTSTTKYRSDSDDGDWSGSGGPASGPSSGPSSSPTPPSFSGIAPKDHIAAEVTPSGGNLDALVVDYSAPETSPDHSGSWGDDSSGPSGSGQPSSSGQPSGDQFNHQSPSSGGPTGGSGDDGSSGGDGGSYGGGGSSGGGQSGRR